MTLEAIETLCTNTTLWTYSYGISSGKRGINLLSGDGISKSPDSLEGALPSRVELLHSLCQAEAMETCVGVAGSMDVMAQTQHNSETGSKLSSMCSSVLIGGEAEEVLSYLPCSRTLSS